MPWCRRFLLQYFCGQGNSLCLALLPAWVFALLYQACCRAISNTPGSGFLLHFHACALTCACSLSVLHALGVLAHFRVFFSHWTLGSVWLVLELELGVADSTHGWVVGRVGLWGLGLAAPAPRFLGTPTSMCDSDVNSGCYIVCNYYETWNTRI